MAAVLRAGPCRLSRSGKVEPVCERSEVLKEGACTVIGVTVYAPSVCILTIQNVEDGQGLTGGRAASVSGVRSEGRRFEGLGRSGEVCVWTIFQSAPIF